MIQSISGPSTISVFGTKHDLAIFGYMHWAKTLGCWAQFGLFVAYEYSASFTYLFYSLGLFPLAGIIIAFLFDGMFYPKNKKVILLN